MPKLKAYLLTEAEASAARSALGLVLAGGEDRPGQFVMAERVQGRLVLDQAVDLDPVLKFLNRMIDHTLDLGCTCATRRAAETDDSGHRPGCTGVRLTRDARIYLARLHGRGVL